MTIEDTAEERRAYSPHGIFTREDLMREIEEGMDPYLAEQEYYCSFKGAMQGSIYGNWIQQADSEGRVKPLELDPYLPVYTYWDLGFTDQTIILYVQETPDETRIIDCYANNLEGLDHYAQEVHNKKWVFAAHYAPWDAEHTIQGKSRKDIMRTLGVRWRIGDKTNIQDGVAAVRRNFKRIYFNSDSQGVMELVRAASEYRWKWDAVNHQFSKSPVHDVYSHYMDALRLWAMSGQIGIVGDFDGFQPPTIESDFDPWTGDSGGSYL